MSSMLVFQLCSNLASMGGPEAVGAFRQSGSFPLNSLIEGVVGAALGLTRDSGRWEDLRHSFATVTMCLPVRTTRRISDFHTVLTQGRYAGDLPQEVSPVSSEIRQGRGAGSFLSRREYLCDVCVDVGLVAREGAAFSLETIAKALKAPHFSLYFGRKSAPLTLPPDPCIYETENFATVFLTYFERQRELGFIPDLKGADEFEDYFDFDGGEKALQADVYWQDLPCPLQVQPLETFTVRDRCINRQAWIFAPSTQHHGLLALTGGGHD